MNLLFLFEARRISKHWPARFIAFILIRFGIFCRIIFKDRYSQFDFILFWVPFSKWIYSNGKFSNCLLIVLLSSSFLMVGFLAGQNLRTHINIPKEESPENLPSHKNTENTPINDSKDSATMIKLSTLFGGF